MLFILFACKLLKLSLIITIPVIIITGGCDSSEKLIYLTICTVCNFISILVLMIVVLLFEKAVRLFYLIV